MTLLERIKKVSKERGYSLTKVNELANLGKNTIYSWKTKEPSYNNLKAVADVLGVSVDYLYGRESETTDDSDLTKNQKLVAYSIDPDISDEEREAIINMVKEAMKFRRRA